MNIKCDHKVFLTGLLSFGLFAILLACSGKKVVNDDVKKAEIVLTTSDHVAIKATVLRPLKTFEKRPAVILIHQGGSDRSEWNPYLDSLMRKRYIVLAYDVRGHGESDKVDNIYQLFDDPDLAPRDLRAAVQYLVDQPDVDSTRMGIVGASIGANLACVGISEMGIKTAVAISGKTSAVVHLSGKKTLNLRSVFYIASEGDQGGKRAEWAQELFEKTASPKKIEIVKNHSGHGVTVLRESPEVWEKILTWLDKTL